MGNGGDPTCHSHGERSWDYLIAEGVESEEQAKMLASMGCDGVQGYFYSQPLEVREYEQLLGD
ncbi:MAG: EAL domain-containing protein, partial [Sphaerochaeta sp.]|uniref:EAL domain-containing protein n=1 Tax=Sphaerochaeta sp. TaxID=1972642 RepID=UPI003D10BAEE